MALIHTLMILVWLQAHRLHDVVPMSCVKLKFYWNLNLLRGIGSPFLAVKEHISTLKAQMHLLHIAIHIIYMYT